MIYYLPARSRQLELRTYSIIDRLALAPAASLIQRTMKFCTIQLWCRASTNVLKARSRLLVCLGTGPVPGTPTTKNSNVAQCRRGILLYITGRYRGRFKESLRGNLLNLALRIGLFLY